MITRVINIYGTVQGVGFRPTTSRYASKFGMRGQVRNMGGLVQLILTDTPERIDAFVEYLLLHKPRSSSVIAVDQKEIDTVTFDGFHIAQSADLEDEIAILPADLALCDRCLAEFRDPKNRRYKHPFISCTDCGPRFTIMDRLPYDRDTTAMDDFAMCDECGSEYADMRGIRYHAQTVSCHDCGPRPFWLSRDFLDGEPGAMDDDAAVAAAETKFDGEVGSAEDDVAAAVVKLSSGSVIALKGVGGYYFVCQAIDEHAVQRLRDIKQRDEKPFAVMFADTAAAEAHCEIGEAEAELLTSKARPIVLLSRRKVASSKDLAPGVCGSSRFVGAFLPSLGLQHLLLEACGPLVMTSANISNMPIIADDEAMISFARSEPRLSGILYNTRRISAAADDSVLRVIDGNSQLIRRSKGYVPVPIYARGAANITKEVQIFAAGGQLKSAFAFSKGAFSYLSQYFGDLDSLESETVYAKNCERMQRFFGIRPGLVCCDMHPNYVTTRFAERMAKTNGLKLLRVQHHHAHIASVMAEHGLSCSVIGVAFDGTGYGTDGNVWGGEVLICKGNQFERFSHLRYVRMTGGDSAAMDAEKSAAAYIAASENGKDVKEAAKGEFEIDISDLMRYSQEHGTLAAYAEEMSALQSAIQHNIGCTLSSSMGRLFDAAAALLGVHYKNRYEGECAIMLENAAQRAIEVPGDSLPCDLALLFHKRVARAILQQCQSAWAATGSQLVALSGGVFQNKVLMDETLARLREAGFRVYYNEHVPPNDGGLALGQNYLGMLSL